MSKKLLGSGVEGAVYLIEEEDGTKYVLKEFRFKPWHEIEFAYRLQELLAHYGLAPNVLECNRNDNTIKMEYVENTITWEQFIRGDPSSDEWFNFVKKFILVLGLMFDIGIEHGDLHPGNILIEKGEKKGEILRILIIDPSFNYSSIYGIDKRKGDKSRHTVESGECIPSSERNYDQFGLPVNSDRLLAEPDAVQNWRHYLALIADTGEPPTNLERALEIVTDEQVQYTLLLMLVAQKNKDKDALHDFKLALKYDIPERNESNIPEEELEALREGRYTADCKSYWHCALHRMWIDLKDYMKEEKALEIEFEELKAMVLRGDGEKDVLYSTLLKGKRDLILRRLTRKREERSEKCMRCGIYMKE